MSLLLDSFGPQHEHAKQGGMPDVSLQDHKPHDGIIAVYGREQLHLDIKC